MQLCIFEGIHYSRLLPLVYTRPTYELRVGITLLREKITRLFPEAKVILHCRSYLADLMKEKLPQYKINELDENEPCLFVNGRVLVEENFLEQLALDDPTDALYVNGEYIIAAKVSGAKLADLKRSMNGLFTFSDFDGLVKKNVNIKVINYMWDAIHHNAKAINDDFNSLMKSRKERILGKVYDGVNIVNKDNIFIDEGASVKPGVVLDAEDGPIYIGKNAKIFPNAVIIGPCFIGNNSAIKAGAKIYEGTSIGEVCKVGGEVEECILHSYSNKQHEGFLGHAYLGQWVNLGADTNNSDLKNNYGSVRVYINDELVDSGSMFVGLTMGDHAKSGINSMFNTGTVVGVGCNIFGAGLPPKYVPSFCWGGADSVTTYDIEKSLEVARRVMVRRKLVLSATEEKVLRKVYDLTMIERKKRGMPN